MTPRDPEASPIFRRMLEAIALITILLLAFVGPDVEESNRQALRDYVNAR